MPSPSRVLVMAAVLTFLPAVFAGSTSPAGAAPVQAAHAVAAQVTQAVTTTAAPTTSAAHPFSNPVYYPLRASSSLDCVKRNPGCKSPHSFWTMDMGPVGQKVTDSAYLSHDRVYAMGAGILHIGEANGATCPSKVGSFGTWVWIDHGGGVVSRYGHLSKILVKAGRVYAGQAIGVVGTTGKGVNCNVAYTDFMVKRNGISPLMANTAQMRTLLACPATGATNGPVAWPTAAPGMRGYATWNAVPAGTVFPRTNSSCIPTAVPATPNRPTATTLTRSGSGRLTVRWAGASAAAHVTVASILLEVYHPSLHAYGTPVYVTVTSGHAHTFAKLIKGRKYRAQVSVGNRAGWSVPTSWRVTATAK